MWIIELGELESLKTTTVETMNGFLTCRVDRYRPPYGTCAVNVPRQCVFSGTTNSYLRDPTGARRIWPVAVTKSDVERLSADRDQIWAEAVHLYRSHHKWWLEEGEVLDLAVIESRPATRGIRGMSRSTTSLLTVPSLPFLRFWATAYR
ncbi:VapE domain-containing protein [Devosia sp.]|uniref:VapE domain-containing protein n=1 Tax=Devosia sp. TaxID=1871048 RepID=UPI0019D86BE0|nr:hypothetical protein [Devosia sp.]